jgi:hypothetical protein
MIKDPLNIQETPYDILEIDVNTPMLDIHKALPRFMKKNKVVSKIAVAQEAIRKLKSIQERLVYDMTYYSLDIMETNSIESLCDISGQALKQIAAPLFNPSDFLTDLNSRQDIIELPEIHFHEEQIINIPEYHDQKIIKLFMPFDTPGYPANK